VKDNEISGAVVDAAVAVHSELGPGLLESVYEQALRIELEDRGLTCRGQVPVPVVYKGRDLGEGYRADLLVEGCVLLELKSVEKQAPVHAKQLMTYLRLLDLRVGLLLNFGAPRMKDGITRLVNGYEESS
jgi:iron complex transport system substrate-binding protein